MSIRYRFMPVLLLLISVLSACSMPVATTPTATPLRAVRSWPVGSPESQGMDAQKLADLLATIEREQINLHSLLIIRNGVLVSETYFGTYGPETQHELFSCTKSVIATLIGIARDQGQIASVEQPLSDFFAAYTARPQGQLSLDAVLTMRTGLQWQDNDLTFREMYRSRDWLAFMLDRPIIEPPGTRFNYCSGCTHILSAVLAQSTGINPRIYAEERLFAPLGITNITWETDPNGWPIGGWGLSMTPRDMAKLGYLYLQNGIWEGRQIVSSTWVQEATRMHTPSDGPLGYGYQWWIYPSGNAYAALGRSGQMIFVAPQQNLVVVTTAQLPNHDRIFDLLDTYILPAID